MSRRSRSIRTEAVVLRQKNFGEADRILTLFTARLGKLSAIAKGVRRPGSRTGGHLDLYQRTDILLAKGRNLYIITQAEVIDGYRAVREDLARVSYASYCAELLDRFTVEEGEAQPPLYDLLTDTLSRLAETPNLALATRYFELQLLALVGFRPDLHTCVIGGETVQAEDQFFSAAEGGVVCPTDGPERPGAVPLSLAALKVLRHLQRSPYDVVQRLQLGQAVHREVELVMERYISTILERRLKSADFVRRVRRVQRGRGEES